jgi:hypothetical protein
MALFDEHGTPVARTTAGKRIGQQLQPQRHQVNYQHGYQRYGFAPGDLQSIDGPPLFLTNYFEVTNSGRYRLELQIGIVWYVPFTNPSTTPQFLFLPPVNAEVVIRMK